MPCLLSMRLRTAIGDDLGELLVRNARMATSELDVQVEAHAKARGADIADVRRVPTDGPRFFIGGINVI